MNDKEAIETINELIGIADTSMREANNDGAEWDGDAITKEAESALSHLTKLAEACEKDHFYIEAKCLAEENERLRCERDEARVDRDILKAEVKRLKKEVDIRQHYFDDMMLETNRREKAEAELEKARPLLDALEELLFSITDKGANKAFEKVKAAYRQAKEQHER